MKLLSLIFAASAIFLFISAMNFLQTALDQVNLQVATNFIGPGARMLVVSVILGICSAASLKAT